MAISDHGDWIHFISDHHETQCRRELFRLYKLSCLCLPPLVDSPPTFTVPLPRLASDVEMFNSCLRSLLLSFLTVAHIYSLYKDPKSVSRVFLMLGRGVDLLMDKKFSIWNFSKKCCPRRTARLGKMKAEYRKAVLHYDRPVMTSITNTPPVNRASSVNSTLSPDLTLGRVSVSLSRCSEVVHEDVSKKTNSILAKGQRNWSMTVICSFDNLFPFLVLFVLFVDACLYLFCCYRLFRRKREVKTKRYIA